jgi:hypothetical protein
MSTALLPLAYLGNIDYYQQLLAHDTILLERFENYPKQTIRNRCVIFGANGPIKLSIPVIRESGTKQLIKDVKISYKESWQKDHWKGIVSAYNASPFFEYYADKLQAFYNTKPEFLLDFTAPLQTWALGRLQADIKTSFTTTYDQNPTATDLRPHFSKNAQTKNAPQYLQVFSDKHGFQPNLSIIDLLFNEGPSASSYLT